MPEKFKATRAVVKLPGGGYMCTLLPRLTNIFPRIMFRVLQKHFQVNKSPNLQLDLMSMPTNCTKDIKKAYKQKHLEFSGCN